MEIKAIRIFDGGFMTQPFAFGGEEGKDAFDEQVIFRSSLQNFLIDTGEEVILVDTGYSPEQVTKILLTHKHPDHSAALDYFPNAKVYVSPEDAQAMNLSGDNIVRVTYKDGSYKNFPAAEKIANGIWFIEAKGHTFGNSIVIAEDQGLFYMFQGDVTYCDAALKANKLSIVYEDRKAARETLDRVREFVKKNPTVYLSTHCPEGYENLEMKRIIKL